MKKSTKFIIALLVTVGALAITYRVVNQAPSKDLAADAQMQEIITSGGARHSFYGSDMQYCKSGMFCAKLQRSVLWSYRSRYITADILPARRYSDRQVPPCHECSGE